MAVLRMVQAGAVPVTWIAVMSEWQRDWAREATIPAVAEITVAHGGASGVAFAWERDQPPAIDIDRRQPSRGEGERVVGPEQHGLGFQQDAGGDFRRIDFARRTIGVRGLGHDLS